MNLDKAVLSICKAVLKERELAYIEKHGKITTEQSVELQKLREELSDFFDNVDPDFKKMILENSKKE